jgi:TolB-like protein
VTSHPHVSRSLATAALVGALVLLGGCSGVREYLQGWQPADAARQQQMDRHYATGAAALAGNDVDSAVVAWRQYVALAPAHLPHTRKLRGYVTLLERESARRFARQAAAGERTAQRAPSDRLHVALFPLRSEGPNAARDTLNRALLAMITTDLAKVPSLTVLERERIDALLREQRLSESGLVDPATLATQAGLLGAGSVVAGSVFNEPGPAGPGSGRYKINTAVSDVTGSRVVGTQEADGRQAEFFRLQKQIVHGILKTLEVKDIPPSVNQIHTRSWDAYVRFASGLSLLAEDRFDEARQAFRAALALDPGFALAEQAFESVPEKRATLQEIQAELRSSR